MTLTPDHEDRPWAQVWYMVPSGDLLVKQRAEEMGESFSGKDYHDLKPGLDSRELAEGGQGGLRRQTPGPVSGSQRTRQVRLTSILPDQEKAENSTMDLLKDFQYHHDTVIPSPHFLC